MYVLGIESSCDETAAAVVENGSRILSNEVVTQTEIHKIYGGVVPEIASRMHTEAICSVVKKAIENSGLSLNEIDIIAVTYAPGLIGALLTGVSFAKGLAISAKKPLVPVHHIRGHISVLYTLENPPKPPFIALCASGGHSSIVEVLDYTKFNILGRTRDDAAGEAYDKVARVLGLAYPGGASIDKLALKGNENAIKFPKVTFEGNPYDFSFSGVKTAVINYIHNISQKNEAFDKADLAASFNKTISETLCEKTILAAVNLGYKSVACVGGVSANSALRKKFIEACDKNGLNLYLPPVSLSGDNGVMPAAQGYFEFLSGSIARPDLNAYANLEINEDYKNLKE